MAIVEPLLDLGQIEKEQPADLVVRDPALAHEATNEPDRHAELVGERLDADHHTPRPPDAERGAGVDDLR